jgi:hypothetical protein
MVYFISKAVGDDKADLDKLVRMREPGEIKEWIV